MSATIHSRIVNLDELIPRTVDVEREDKDVENLIPWVFQQTDNAQGTDPENWPNEEKESWIFDDYLEYCSDVRRWREPGSQDIGITNTLKSTETITLPKKSRSMCEDVPYSKFISTQGSLRLLTKSIYFSLDTRKEEPRLRAPASISRMKYMLGDEVFRTGPEGAVTVGSLTDDLPIISFPGWYEDHTWSKFLAETLSVMLGQLAKNFNVRHGGSNMRDQEIYVVGFHGCDFYIARGFFKADIISRVHTKGCSEDEVFQLNFSRGYNLCLKEDWLEATRGLTRLFRYLLSGNAKAGAMRAYLAREAENASGG